MILLDSYSETNQSGYGSIWGSKYGASQSFNADSGGVLNSAKFYVERRGSPTGNVYAKLYSHSGVFGSTSVPNTLLATSGAVDITGISDNFELVNFTFSGGEKYSLQPSTYYCIAVYFDGGSSGNDLKTGDDYIDPTHEGNESEYDEGWDWETSDLCFYVYIDGDSPSSSYSPSESPSVSLSPSLSPSISPSESPSQSLSPSLSPSISPSQSPSQSISPSLSPSLSFSGSPSASISPSQSLSPSLSPSISPSISSSISPSESPSISISPSLSPSISPSISPSVSPSESLSPSISPSLSPSISSSTSPSQSLSPSLSPSISPSISSSLSPSLSSSLSPSISLSLSPSISPSISSSLSPSISSSLSPSVSPSISPSVSPSPEDAPLVEIGGVNRSSNIDWTTLRIKDYLDDKPSTCSFIIKKYGTTKTYKPSLASEVNVEFAGSKIFAGVIIRITDTVVSGKMQKYQVECVDYTRYLSRRLIPDTFANQTVDAIIASLITDYFDDDSITGNNVDCTNLIDDIRFDYARGDECLRRLAEITNYHWYIDYDKDIHFFANGDEVAPFNISDNSQNYFYNSLKIIEDDSQIKNVIYVRGSDYLGDEFTDVIVADGETITFWTAYQLDSIQIWVDAGAGYVVKTVGVDGVDAAGDYDCLYNFNDKAIKFPDATKPVATNTVKYTGKPLLPVITKMNDPVSQTAYGKYEYKILDTRIKTKQSARERAEAELTSYKDSLIDATFRTVESGLRAGQEMTISLTARGISGTYIIKSVAFKTRTYNSFYYEVELINTVSLDVIEFLQKLIQDIDNSTKFLEDEGGDTVVDLIMSLSERNKIQTEMTINATKKLLTESPRARDVLLRASKDNPPTWVAGTYSPTSNADRKRPAYADRSNLLAS